MSVITRRKLLRTGSAGLFLPIEAKAKFVSFGVNKPQPVTDLWTNLDGRLNASTGNIQFPTRLNNYTPAGARHRTGLSIADSIASGNFQPPWMVAGVDYPVGINASAFPLKVPNVDPLPPNCSIDVPSSSVQINDTTTVDGWDFTGWQLLVNGGINSVIKNCNFFNGGYLKCFQHPPGEGGSADGLIIRYNNFDYNNNLNQIDLNISGDHIVEYNYFANAKAIFVQWATNETTPLLNVNMRYNYMIDTGLNFAQGAHGDFTRIDCGSCGDIAYTFNTVVQTQPTTQGWSHEAGGNLTNTFNCNNNTMIAFAGTAVNYFVLAGEFRIRDGIVTKDNYVDPTGNTQQLVRVHVDEPGPYSVPPVITGNFSMLDGSAYNTSGG